MTENIKIKPKYSNKRKTTDEYKKELEVKNPDVEVLEEYVDVKTPILHKFSCGHINRVYPSNVLKGSGCNICNKRTKGDKLRKTTETFINELHNINKTINVIGKYEGANKPISVECSICKYKWSPLAYSLIKNKHACGCPNCAGNTKKTHEQFVLEVKDKINPNVIIIGQYNGMNNVIKCQCKNCNRLFDSIPTRLMIGNGCKNCSDKKKGKQKTHEKFLQELQQIHGDKIKILDQYLGSNIKIQCECTICGYKWHVKPSSLIHQKTGCPKCAGSIVSDLDFNKRFKENGNPNIILTGKYVNSHTRINGYCKVCGYEVNMLPHLLIHGAGCKRCNDTKNGLLKRKAHEQFIEEVKQINPNIQIMSKYNSARSKVDCRCLKCTHEWSAIAASLISQKNGCPKCAQKIRIKKITKTHDEYISDVKKYNPYIEILGEYQGGLQDIVAKCLVCNNEWTTKAKFLLKRGCPKCAYSKSENIVEQCLDKLNINYIHPKRYDDLIGVGGRLLSYDFYLPDYNLLIEFQGEQHEHPVEYFGGEEQFKVQQEHDKRKREYAKEHNINLLEIWYYEIDNTENILKETLNNLKLESVETVIPT